MNRKMIYILVAILAILLAVSYLQKSLDRATGEPETLNELQLSFNPDSVTRIDVFKQAYPDSGLHFQKQDAGWVLTNEYNTLAKQSDVQKLIDDLHNVGGSIRGESADLYDSFDITDEKALQIEFYDREDNKLLHVYVGKGGASGKECFMRIAGSPVTYLAYDNFLSRFAVWNAAPEKKLATDRWLDLSLCEISSNDMSSFKIIDGKKTYEFANELAPSEDSLTLPERVWAQVSPQKGPELETNKIRGLSSSLAGLRARGVVNPANSGKNGLDKPKCSIIVTGNSGNQITIKFSNPIGDDEERYAEVSGRDSVYKIDKGTYERIFVNPFKTN